MDPLVFNIAVDDLAKFPESAVVIRSHSAARLADAVRGEHSARIEAIQLLSPEADVSPLAELEVAVPIDIVLSAPAEQYRELHKFATLRDGHPIRVTIAVVPGFSKSVQVAAALQFAVKLDVGQPDAELVGEMLEALNLYLHRSTVARSVEFFHTALLSFFNDVPDSLWQIQDEDPAVARFVSDADDSRRHRRTASSGAADPSTFVDDFGAELRAEERECVQCEYAPLCRGYFKYPDRTYDCSGVRKIFNELESAARLLAADLHAGNRP